MNESKSMKEIHKIRENLYEKWKNKSDKEVVNDISKSAKEIVKKLNLNLVSTEKKVLVK